MSFGKTKRFVSVLKAKERRKRLRTTDPSNRNRRHNAVAPLTTERLPISEKAYRFGIAMAFRAFGYPEKSEWQWRGGTVRQIMKMLCIPPGSSNSILKTLHAINSCHERGVHYDGARLRGSGGGNKLIEMNSTEDSIIARSLEIELEEPGGIQSIFIICRTFIWTMKNVHISKDLVLYYKYLE